MSGILPAHIKLTQEFSEQEIDELKTALTDPNNFFLLYALHEPWTYNAINEVLDFLEVKPDQSNVVLVLDRLVLNRATIGREVANARLYSPNGTKEAELKFNNVYFYDYFCAMSGAYEDDFGSNNIVNLDTNKFLFLMGNPHSTARITLLYEFFVRGMLQDADWSFHPLDLSPDTIRKNLPEITDKEFGAFMQYAPRTLDNIKVFSFRDVIMQHRTFYVGYPIDPALYEKTSFSVISESVNWFPGFVTEKTWRTIANKHAFVMSTCDETLSYLESLGLDTFRYMQAVPNPSSNATDNDFVYAASTNTDAFLKNIEKNKQAVGQSVMHNYKVYRNIVDNQRNVIDKFLEPFINARCFQPESKSQYTIIGEDALRCINKLQSFL